MKTSFIKLIVTIAAVGLLANAALAKNGKSGGNGNSGGNSGNRSMFKLNSSSGNSSRNLSSSSSSSNNLFKFKGSGSGNGSSISSRVFKLNGNNHGSSQQVFKSNGNNGNGVHSNMLGSNNNTNNNNKFFNGVKGNSGNKFFNKNDKHDHHNGKFFSKHCHNGYCYPNWYNYCHSYPSYPCYGHLTTIPLIALAYEPLHCNYVVLPGDTCYNIAFKEYGTSITAKHIVVFNGLGLGSGLTPGLILNLPSVSPSGGLTPSGAPIAEALRMSPINANAMQPASPMMVGGPISPMTGTAGPMAPMTGPVGPMSTATSTTPVAPANMTAPRPKIMVGSTLQVDGQTFGDKPGVARLVIGGVALKIEVIEWLGSAVKIRLPQLELAGPSSADIEILRADGSLAAKTPVELASATEVALAQ